MIGELIDLLPRDPWRKANPFSPDIQECHHVLFRPGSSRAEMETALNSWLAANQPCEFGRMEAKLGRLAYCILTENDLERGDDHVRMRIAEDREAWRSRARRGESHGFIILAISSRIAEARVSSELLTLAELLCELYLGDDGLDRILLDELILETQAEGHREYRAWRVGVNYFSTQGDGRWWRDHRIPGGMAFSMNSVGHMARTRADAMLARDATLAASCADVPRERLTYWALPTAMRTIGAPKEDSKRGTWLAERGRFVEDREPPTFDQRKRVFGNLAKYSENRYEGRYHTDETIPSPYFNDTITALSQAPLRDDLLFTYLHSLKDEDYERMGVGRLVQALGEDAQADQSTERGQP